VSQRIPSLATINALLGGILAGDTAGYGKDAGEFEKCIKHQKGVKFGSTLALDIVLMARLLIILVAWGT